MENRVKILIADGNEEFCEHLSRTLKERSAFDVTGVAHDGETAVQLLEREHPDVLVLDLMLARLAGFRSCAGRRSWKSRRWRSSSAAT